LLKQLQHGSWNSPSDITFAGTNMTCSVITASSDWRSRWQNNLWMQMGKLPKKKYVHHPRWQ